MDRKNCWEVMKCERQPGGARIEELGACPAALPNDHHDGVNKGKHGGRFCWAIAGTMCEGRPQGTYAEKLMDCIRCEFLKLVNEDEGRDFVLSPPRAKGH
jgi:hypothetical protein